MRKYVIIGLLTLSLNSINAQITTPQPSPMGTISQKVGLNDITIAYSRPSAKDRKVFGDLVPYGELWRTGANRSVKLSLSDSTTIGGKKIGKGDYSIFTIPTEKEWTIVINKAVDLSGTNGYKQEDDIVRFNVPVQKIAKVETFTFNFANITNTSTDIEIMWEEVKVAFKAEVSFDEKVMKSIDATLNPSAGSYFSAARYYYESNRDSKQALEWINKALSIGGDKYWILRTKSLIQARLEDYKGAIETANKSLTLAKADSDGSYIKMNEASIAEWTAKLNTKTKGK